MASSFSINYPYKANDDYSYVVRDSDRDGKGVVVHRTSHLTSQNICCCIDGGNFVSYQRSYYSTMSC